MTRRRTIGKKKKIYIVQKGAKGKSLVPLLLGGGIIAYFLFFRKSSTPVPPVTDPNIDKTGTSGTWYASSPETGEGYTPSGVHYTYTHTAYNWVYKGDPMPNGISITVLPTDTTVPVDWGTQYWDPFNYRGVTQANTTTPVPPPIVYTPPTSQPTDTNYAQKALIDKRQQLYNGVAYGNYPGTWIDAFHEMYNLPDINQAISELQTSWNYLNRYWGASVPLTSADQPLYNNVIALRAKYGIF